MKKLLMTIMFSASLVTIMSGCGGANASNQKFIANTDKPVESLERMNLLDIKESIKNSEEINPERKKVLISAIDSFL